MDLLELETAIKILLENIEEVEGEERVSLLSSQGRILSRDIYAKIENPPFNRSPLDGFTLNFKDTQGATEETPIFIEIIDTIDAGRNYSAQFLEKTGLGIMTGAMIPEGYNCVIRQEDVEFGVDSQGKKGITLKKELKLYENFVFKGEDIKKNSLLMRKGEKITHHHIGVLATMGEGEIFVKREITVGILSTGDELSVIGEPLEPAKIYNSNLYMLTARMKSFGINVRVLSVCKDCPKEVDKIIKENIDSVDLFITTGGVSVGRKDIFHEVVKLEKNKKLFWKIKIQPGTPILAWKKQEKLVVSLSGNPFAALTTFELLVRPLLAKLTKDRSLEYRRKVVPVQGEFLKASSKRRFVRGRYEDGTVFLESSGHSSGELFSSLSSNCLIDIPPNTLSIKSGDRVSVVIL